MTPTSPLTQLHQQAETSLSQKNFQKTIALCRQILKTQPQSAPAYKTLGKALAATKDFDGAARAYQQAITIAPDSPEAYANLGSIRAQQKQWQDALKCYQKAIELKPDFAGVYRNVARLWERLNKPEQAVQAWEKAYSLEPETVKPQERLKLGDEFLKLGQTEKAISCYQRAIEAQPNWLEAYHRLGDALEKEGRWEEATETWKKAMSCGQQQGETKTAIADQPEPAAKNGQATSIEATRRTCQDYIEKKQWSEAIAAAKQALALQEDAQLWHLLGKAQQGAKQPQAAAQSYRNAIALQPLPESYANLGSLYAKEKQWESAIAHFQEALKIDSERAGIWRNLARAFAGAGNAEKAALAWYRAYRLAPSEESAEQHLKLGDTLMGYGKLTEAIACYQFAIEQKPNWSLAHSQLGEALQKAERWEEATASLRRAIECQQEETPQNPPDSSLVPEKNGYDASKALLEKALENDDAETYLRLTQVYVEKEQWQRAIAAARQALAIQPDAISYRWLGKALHGGKQMQEAKQCYKAAVSLKPSWAEPKVDLGDWHSTQQQWRQARTCYQEALKLDHSNVAAYRGLAQAFEKLGQRAKATEYRYQALSQEGSAQECLELAKGLARQKRLEEAISCCRQALSLEANFPEAYQELGTLFARQGQIAEAIKSYRQALQQNPDSAATWQLLGKALVILGQQEEAAVCYRQAEWLLTRSEQSYSQKQLPSPQNFGTGVEQALAIQQQAEAALQQGEPEAALKQYRQAFAYLTGKKPSQGQVDIFLFSETESEQLSLENYGNQSLASLTRLTLIAETFPTFTKGLAWFLEGLAKLKGGKAWPSSPNVSEQPKEKKIDPVIDISSEASEEAEKEPQEPESSRVLADRARACLEAGDLDRCLVTCQELVEHYPQHAAGYKLLGQARHKRGEFSLALEAYRSAIALHPKDVEVLIQSGQVSAKLEQWQDAVAHYQQALEHDPKRWEVYHYLGDALQASGDIEGAIVAYEKAVELAE